MVLALASYVGSAFVCHIDFVLNPLLSHFFRTDAGCGTDPLLASHWAVGTFVAVSLGTWSVLDSPSWRRRPDSEPASPLAQDNMSAEYLGRAEAGADRRRTTSQASARKNEGLGDAAVTILIHGCIVATRKTKTRIHAYLYPQQSSPKETSLPMARHGFPGK